MLVKSGTSSVISSSSHTVLSAFQDASAPLFKVDGWLEASFKKKKKGGRDFLTSVTPFNMDAHHHPNVFTHYFMYKSIHKYWHLRPAMWQGMTLAQL